jgi:hypothetical protein
MTALLALLLTVTAPARTDWMRLESFHLTIGMSRAEAVEAVRSWNPKPGKDANEVVIDYSGEKSLTLEFRKDRLQSARFELFVFLPEVRQVFDERREALRTELGEPRKATKSIVIYDHKLPNVMMVLVDDPKSENGKKGLGVLAVRYYDPR